MDEQKKYQELLSEQRHQEVLEAIGKIVTAMAAGIISETELRNVIQKNTEAINTFGKVPEVNVVSNQEVVVEAVGKLAEMFAEGMAKMEDRLKLMEIAMTEIANRPLPVKLQAIRPNKYNENIEFMVIEYNKTT